MRVATGRSSTDLLTEQVSGVEALAVVWRGIRREPGWFTLAVLGSVVWAGSIVGVSRAVGWAVEHVVEPAAGQGSVTWRAALTGFAVVLGAYLLQAASMLVRRLSAGLVTFRLGATYRRLVTDAYLRLPLSWHRRHPGGQLLSNANADVDTTWRIFMPLPMFVGVLFLLVFAGVSMYLVDPLLAAVGAVVFPVLAALNIWYQRVMSPRAQTTQELRGEVSRVAHESFEAGLLVKSMGREDAEAGRFGASATDLRDAAVSMGRVRGLFDPLIEALPQVGTLAVLVVGTWRASHGHVSTGEVVQVAYLFTMMAMPVRALGWTLSEAPASAVGWRRVQAVLTAPTGPAAGTRRLPGTGGLAVRVRGLVHAHEDAPDDPALRGVDLDLPAGSTVALVGATGAGKSTLASAALGLVRPTAGTIEYDGVPLEEVAPEALVGAASLVEQTAFLFDDTVRFNVALGADLGDEELWAALELAQAADFVRALPDGLDQQVGERGGSLSGGQRQRIALARAVVRRPRFLVLDDATSALDPAVEQAVLSRLREARAGMTVLVVAYRMATIALADTVAYLEDGRVVATGSHAELMASQPGYARVVGAYAVDHAQRQEQDGGRA
ncbi:ABC transporter ATP-binding protein [Kytococcus schroeteri]|uniref:ABC transporter ATP-binding protein n=1 Tax=Kytococcus schroeteri TaxID=138300 RepID=UPI0011426481|nr:ABC transporter ATP-binding protein [Kytococcus schroeteri]